MHSRSLICTQIAFVYTRERFARSDLLVCSDGRRLFCFFLGLSVFFHSLCLRILDGIILQHIHVSNLPQCDVSAAHCSSLRVLQHDCKQLLLLRNNVCTNINNIRWRSRTDNPSLISVHLAHHQHHHPTPHSYDRRECA